jgi:hypothetical protein
LPFRAPHLAVEPASGLIVVAANGLLTVLGWHRDRLRPLASTPSRLESVFHICFAGPDRVVAARPYDLSLWWWRRGEALEAEPAHPLGRVCGGVAFLPRRRTVAVGITGQGVSYLDLDTLGLVWNDEPQEHSGPPGKWLWGSPCTGSYGIADAGSVRVFLAGQDALRELALRPMASVVPRDLAVLATARRQPLVRAAAGPLLDLLDTNLRHRLGDEIRLDAATTAGEYDISLGDGA